MNDTGLNYMRLKNLMQSKAKHGLVYSIWTSTVIFLYETIFISSDHKSMLWWLTSKPAEASSEWVLKIVLYTYPTDV